MTTELTNFQRLKLDKWMKRTVPSTPEETEDIAQFKTPQIPTSAVKGDVPKEQIEKAVNNISRLSQITTTQFIGLANGLTVTLTSTISDIVYPDKVMLAVAEITPYDAILGNLGSIIRPGSSWSINTGYDYDYNSRLSSDGKSLTAYQSIYNQSGSTKNIYWYIRWRFFGTNTAS